MKRNFTLLLVMLSLFCTCITPEMIVYGSGELSVSAVECRIANKVVADKLEVIPYATDAIHLFFNTELDEESVDGAVVLTNETQEVDWNISTGISDDKKTLIVSVNELMSKDSSFILKIGEGIRGIDGSVPGNELSFSFATDNKTTSIIIDNYFDESFDDFTANANGTNFPTGWYRQSSDGSHIGLDGMFREDGVQGYDGDGALKMASKTSDQRIMTRFDKVVPSGTPVSVDFDVYRGGGNGFYICMLADDLDFNGNTTMPDGSVHYYYSNLTVGTAPISLSPDISSVAPNFGYAPYYTDYRLIKFADDHGNNLLLEQDKWHSVHMELNPVGESKTLISVSIDGGEVFNATTQQDFYTHKMAGIALYGLRVVNSGTLMEPMDVRFDNVHVYTEDTMQVPYLENIAAVTVDGTKISMETPIPSSCESFELRFNTAFDTSNIDKLIELSNGSQIVPCTFEAINQDRGIRITPKKVLDANSSYKLCLKGGLSSKYSKLMVNNEEQNIYFRTKDDGVFNFLSTSIEASGDNAVFSAEFQKTADTDDKYIMFAAEYATEVKTVNGKLKKADHMIGSEMKAITFDSNDSGEVTKTIEITKSGTGKKFAGYMLKSDGTYVSGAETYIGGFITSDAKNILTDENSVVIADANALVLPYKYAADDSAACVLIFKGDMDKINFEDTSINNKLAYIGLMQSNDFDMVSFFTLNEPGNYTAFISKDNTSGLVRIPFSYVNKTENKVALDAIRDVIKNRSGSGVFLNTIDTNISGIAHDTDYYAENDLVAATMMYDYLVKQYGENTEAISNEILYELIGKAYLLSAIKADRISNVSKELCDSIRGSDYENYYLADNASANAYISSALKSAESIETYEDLLRNAVCLSAIGYSGNTQMVKDVIGYLGLRVPSDNVIREINGKVFNSVADLEKKINELNNSGSGSNNTGGGSSSGGSYTSKNTQSADKKLSGITYPVIAEHNTQESIEIFGDIDNVSWAKDAIEDLYFRGIVSGKEDNIFAPTDNVLREEFVKMIVEAFRLNTIGDNMNFEDVKESDWYYKYIERAYYSGIVNGESEIWFGAGKNITRQDLAVMIYNTCKVCGVSLPDNNADINFEDADMINEYATESVWLLCNAGIISGYDGKFHPQDNATRAEAAKILFNILQYVK